ncbi:unnamed protein product [Anisakis simplex]|uniref:Uncharacterized protein n=1 Tax=Anisakis simplex TaxID=6269 RepID=A0A0M3J9B4_ANISI|nr:unnamed protein product [Anisakis simplex]
MSELFRLENISFTLDSGSHTSSASTVPSMQSPSSDNIDCADLNTSQSTFYVNDADHNLLDSSKISANFKCLLNIASSNSVKVSTPLSSDDTPEAKTSRFLSNFNFRHFCFVHSSNSFSLLPHHRSYFSSFDQFQIYHSMSDTIELTDLFFDAVAGREAKNKIPPK